MNGRRVAKMRAESHSSRFLIPLHADNRIKVNKTMLPKISLTDRSQEIENLVLLVSSLKTLPDGVFTTSELSFIRRQHKELKKDIISYNRLENWIYIYVIKDEKADYKRLEECRKAGGKVGGMLNSQKAEKVVIFDHENHPAETLAFAEGMALGNYQFLKLTLYVMKQ